MSCIPLYYIRRNYVMVPSKESETGYLTHGGRPAAFVFDIVARPEQKGGIPVTDDAVPEDIFKHCQLGTVPHVHDEVRWG